MRTPAFRGLRIAAEMLTLRQLPGASLSKALLSSGGLGSDRKRVEEWLPGVMTLNIFILFFKHFLV